MSRAGATWIAALVLSWAGFGLAGCSDESAPSGDEVAVYDFVRDFAVAETAWERSRLRVGDPVFAERMGSGWSRLEADSAGASFRWTEGRRAEFDVFVAKPRDVELACRCQAFSWPGAPNQELTVEVGDFRSRAAVVAAAPDSSATELQIPASAWRPGWNQLVLESSRATAPADVIPDSGDVRELALRVEALEFRGLLDSESPSVASGILRMPVGSAVRSYGEGAGQRWQLGAVESTTSARLGVYQLTPAGRQRLEPGAVDVPLGQEMAVELLAEPADPPWWYRLLASDSGEIQIGAARVVLTPDQIAELNSAAGVDAALAADSTGRMGSATGVIVYMVDTLRADRLGVYGSSLGLTPRLDALAAESVVFTEARAQSSWTRPSVVSTFTGLYPQSHGVDDRDDALSAEVETLAERLHASGIVSGAIFTNGNVSHQFGLGQGFSEYRYLQESNTRETVHVLADELNQWGLHWLAQHRESHGDTPYFLYLHATDPHAPYTPRQPFADRFAPGADSSLASLDAFRALRVGEEADHGVRDQLLALYDAEVAWTDHQIGEFVDDLRERGLWDQTLFLVVSDHGEEFLEHGAWEHGKTLFDEQLLVPLLIKLPRGVGSARRVGGPAGHVDLAPTILDALGVAYDPAEFDGRSLWPAMVADPSSDTQSTGAPALSHLELADESLRSVVAGSWKLVEDFARERRELFELKEDPAELEDVSAQEPLRAGVLSQERRRLEESVEAESAGQVELDEETKKQLEALGYAG